MSSSPTTKATKKKHKHIPYRGIIPPPPPPPTLPTMCIGYQKHHSPIFCQAPS